MSKLGSFSNPVVSLIVSAMATLAFLAVIPGIADGLTTQSDDAMTSSALNQIETDISNACDGNSVTGNIELPQRAEIVIDGDELDVRGIELDRDLPEDLDCPVRVEGAEDRVIMDSSLSYTVNGEEGDYFSVSTAGLT